MNDIVVQRFSFKVSTQSAQNVPDRFLTPSDFHHSRNCRNKRRKKLHYSEISKKLFPEYHDRRTTERTFSNMYIHSDFSIDTDLIIEKVSFKRN
ncbi:hypothetical protein T07_8233 [Trichinella nelsoni]|uniref:Uncharacterized protein n=1 Tax=Trichinella nelsoni TaxID=6336 RepID=A0A0V0SC43_9BILA|nr:hypothetical protein T07_8233 [Trichinella nelsoni]